MLSWTLPDPGTREFSVCNSETKTCLLHITGYNDVRAASDKFTSRVRFIGHVSSSGTGLFRFVLSDVTWEDEGHYKCYRGSPGSGGPIISDCGQKLVVQDDAMIGDTVTLSCRLPQPAVREFTVWNSNWSIPLAHVTNFKDANIVSEVYKSRLTLRFHGKDLLILELEYVVLNDGGQFRCHTGTPDSIGSRIADCGQQLNVYAGAAVYARQGRIATLSWRLHQPAVREFTVRKRFSSDITLFHVTNYNKVDITSTYRTRAEFTGNIDSSGSGVFSFLLYDVVLSDGGPYRCYSGSPGSIGYQMSDCGQKLDVIYIQDPYIVALETVKNDSSVNLTCSSFTRTYYLYSYSYYSHLYIPDVSIIWRKNGDQLETGGRYHLTDNKNVVSEESTNRFYYHSTLTISTEEEGDRFTCQADRHQRLRTDWSEEYTLSRTWAKTYTDYTVVQEGDNATVTWKMPLSGDWFNVRTPDGGELLRVKSTDIYIWDSTYLSRVKITGVIRSTAAMVVRFTLYGVTTADAGKYYCDGGTSCEHVLVVSRVQDPYIVTSNTSVNNSTAKLTCCTFFRHWPENHALTMTVTWKLNHTELLSGGQYQMSAAVEKHVNSYWTHNLTVRDLGRKDDLDMYTCRMMDKHGFKTEWSQEYAVGMNTWTESYTDYTVVQEGDNATVTWKMPLSGDRFYVKTPSGGTLLLIKSTDIYIEDSYWSRVKITGVFRSFDAMVVRFTLCSLTTTDAGKYYCTGATSCEHVLVVSRVQDPYIVTSVDSKTATLTCYTFFWYLPEHHALTMTVTWRQNHTELLSGGQYQMSAAVEKHENRYWTHNLTVRDLGRKDDLDMYTCRMMDKHSFKTEWSQDYAVGMNTLADSFTDYTVVQEGDNAMVTWKMPLSGDWFSVTPPAGGQLMNMKSTFIISYLSSRVKISGVFRLLAAVVVRFTLYNVTTADAGKYYCRRLSNMISISGCEHILVVAQGQYIAAHNTSLENGRASLTCYTYCKGSDNLTLALSVTWRRNHEVLSTGGRYAVSAKVQRHRDAFWTSALIITGVEKTDTGYRYSCQVMEKHGLKSDWSQEYIVGVNTLAEGYTDCTVINEGDKAMAVWKIPNRNKFEERSAIGLLSMDSGKVFLNLNYRMTTTVITSPESVVLWLQFHNATTDDAGNNSCKTISDDDIIPVYTYLLDVFLRPIFTGITVNGRGNVIVNEHETVSFQCDVHSIPPPSSIHVQQTETNSIHNMVIKDINCTHTGTYVCVARNVVGVTTGKETVAINNVISQPRRCDSSDKYLAMSYDSQSVSGTFLVCSYPEPENHIMEYLDKGVNVIDMSDSPRHTLSKHEGERFYTFTFSISKMQTSDLGTYKLSVINEKGTLEIFAQLFDQGTTMTNTIIVITSSVTIFIASVFITVAVVAFRRLKKSHERRAASSYISPIRDVLASAGRVWYDGYHVYADVDDSEVQGNLPGPRRASNSSSSDDDYEAVGQAAIVVHLQPGNQQPVQVADIQESNIDEHEPPQAQQCSSQASVDAPATVESILQPSSREKPDSPSATLATPYYLTATEDKTSPQPSSSKKPDTASATSATPYYLTATEDKTSPQPSSSKKPDTPGATSATPYYLTATEDKTSPQSSSSKKPDTPGATSATPYYLTATEDKTSPQPSSSMTPDTASAASATPYYLTATEDKTSPQPSSSMTPDTASAMSATPYYLTATEDKTSPQPSSSKKPDTPSATSATPYYLTATEDKTSPQPSSSKMPDTASAPSAKPYHSTATKDESSPRPSFTENPDTASASSATPYYVTATEDKFSPEKPDTVSVSSTTPYYVTATEDKFSPEKPDTASVSSTTPHHLTEAEDDFNPQTSSTEKPETASATSTTPHHLADAVDESCPTPTSSEKTDSIE